MEEVLKNFPQPISLEIYKNIKERKKEVEEIRLRINQYCIIKLSSEEKIIPYKVNKMEIMQIFQKICDQSVYSYQNQIVNGYITIKGGHRVGLTGDVVVENGKIINIRYISSLNFRIAHQILDCSNSILRYILDIQRNQIYNTLIVSSPGAGKTTLLKDLVRKISSGIPEIYFHGLNVSVVDERGEIAAMYQGEPQNDIGTRTDVLENITKPLGIKMALRSMAPQVIIADEIGKSEDVQAIEYAICSGVKGVFSAHGNSLEEILSNSELEKLLQKNIIERIILLDNKARGHIKKVYELNKSKNTYIDLDAKKRAS